jgi:hypothetical protein
MDYTKLLDIDIDMDMDMDMKYGVFTFIIPDTIFNNLKKYMDYELEPDQNSQLLFTYDNEPNIVKEFDMKTNNKMKEKSSTRRHGFPQTFQFQIEKGLTLFCEDTPIFLPKRGEYVLKSLKQIFYKNVNFNNCKPSIYNCVYYIHTPTKKNAFSIVKISFNRYLFAYQPKYLNKTELEQIVFELFIKG